MSDQAAVQEPLAPAPPEPVPRPQQIALAVSILLFVGLFLWGFVLSMVEMSERDSTT